MAGQTVDYIVRVRGATDASVNQAIGELQKFVNAQEGVAVSAEKMARAQVSAEKALERHSRQLDTAFRHQKEMERLQKDITRAREQGLNVDEQATRLTALLTERQQAASRAQRSLADTTKLSRYEMINLSRQIQDVGVGLASGQSPFTVLVQQGTQIADVFAASQTTVRQFFSQALGWAGRFVASTAGVVTGVTAIGAGALLAASNWSSGQRDIERSLTGIGRASGATRDSINAIAEASAGSSKASASEAREAAAIFAQTGKIYVENFKQATDLAKEFSLATGVSAKDAAKSLAEALSDPVQGAMELNKTLGFLDGKTLDLIRTLEIQNKHQEAQRVLMDAATKDIQEQASKVGFLTQVWDNATKAASAYIDAAGRAAARGIEGATGANLGGFGDDERLARARARVGTAESAVQQRESVIGQPGVPQGLAVQGLERANKELAAARAELQRLEAAAMKAAVAVGDKRFNQMGIEADNAVRALIPQIAATEKLTEKLNDLKRAQEGVTTGEHLATGDVIRGGQAGGGRDNQEAIARTQLLLKQQEDSRAQQARQTEEALKTAAAYGNISIAAAQTLQLQEAQLPVARAVTETEKLAAQEQARMVELQQQGFSATEQQRIAAGERANAEAQISAQAEQQLRTLQLQEDVAGAVTGAARMEAQERATIAQLLAQAVPLSQAIAIAEQQTANTQAALNAGAMQRLEQLQDQERIIKAVSEEERNREKANATLNDLLRQGVSALEAQLVADQQLANAEEQRHQRENDAIEREQAAQARSLATSRERLRVERMRAEAAAEAADQAETEAAHQRRIASGQTLAGEFFGPNTGGTGRTFTGISNIRLARQITEQQALGREAVPVPGKGGINQVLFRETDTSIRNMINDLLRTGGDLSQAIRQISELPGDVLSSDLRFSNLMDLMRRQTELTGSSAEEIAMLRQQIAQVGNQPRSLEQMDLLKTLNDRLKQLTEATENLSESLTDILSPLYTSDPRLTHLGFRAGSRPLDYDPFKQPIVVPTITPSPTSPSPTMPGPSGGTRGYPWAWPGPTGPTGTPIFRFAEGGVMSSHGTLPLRTYQGGGIVSSAQMAIYGEGSMPEAIVPLPDGRRIPVQISPNPTSWGKERGLPPHQVRPVVIQNFFVRGDVDREAVMEMKMSAFQGAQQAQRAGSLG